MSYIERKNENTFLSISFTFVLGAQRNHLIEMSLHHFTYKIYISNTLLYYFLNDFITSPDATCMSCMRKDEHFHYEYKMGVIIKLNKKCNSIF